MTVRTKLGVLSSWRGAESREEEIQMREGDASTAIELVKSSPSPRPGLDSLFTEASPAAPGEGEPWAVSFEFQPLNSMAVGDARDRRGKDQEEEADERFKSVFEFEEDALAGSKPDVFAFEGDEGAIVRRNVFQGFGRLAELRGNGARFGEVFVDDERVA